MDFDKLAKELDAIFAEESSQETPVVAEKKMSAKEFGDYAKDQVAKAKAEAGEKKKPELAKKRLEALKAEVDKIAKFAFKDSELPTVVVYKDEEQLDTTETEISPVSQQVGEHGWVAKSAEFGAFLSAAIKELGPKQEKAGEKQTPAPAEEPVVEAWPTDLAKCIKPSRSDKDTDYQWGADPR